MSYHDEIEMLLEAIARAESRGDAESVRELSEMVETIKDERVAR